MSINVSEIKQAQRRMWSLGDYPEIAKYVEQVAEVLVERVGAAPGQELLDVATGSGNVAIAAAQRGASVTGLDLTPELLAAARRRGADAGVEIRWVEGDAEELPFEDGAFDSVTSCFGVMFAPRHERAAQELVRVARPGATIALAAWTPEGLNGRLFKIVGSYMPPPPPELKPATMWGTEEHVRELLGASGADVTFERRTVTFTHDSPEGWLDYNVRVLGPSIMATAALEAQGRWGELEGELLELYREGNEASEGSFSVQAEYLLTVAKTRV
jgi:SAM-dependent methyltransferase